MDRPRVRAGSSWRTRFASAAVLAVSIVAGVAASGSNGPEATAAAATEREVPELRTRRSATFATGGGRYVSELYTHSLHYRDGAGDWQPIDSTLRPSARPAYAYENAANRYRLSLPTELADEPVRVEHGQDWVEFALQGARGAPTATANKARFSDALPGVDITYTAEPDSAKEELRLLGPGAPSTFTFALATSPGLEPRLNDHGGVDLVRAGAVELTFAPPFMYTDGAGVPETSTAVSYELRDAAGGWELVLRADPTWLDEKLAEGPVVIDPTVQLKGTDQECAYIKDKGNQSTCTGQSFLKVQNASNSKLRPLLRFGLGSLPAGADVTAAQLVLTGPVGAARAVAVHELTKPWTTAATWTRYDSTSNWAVPGGDFVAPAAATATVGALPGPSEATSTWPLPSALVEAWLTQAKPNHGLILVQPGTLATELSFNTSAAADPDKRPRLEVSYLADTELTQKPADPANSNDPSLAFASMPPGSGFKCRLDSSNDPDWPARSDTDWGACQSPKAYVDVADGTYRFEVAASDTAGDDPTPASWTWKIDTAAPNVTLADAPPAATTDTTPTFAGVAGTLDGASASAAADGQNVSLKVYPGSTAAGAAVRSFTLARADSSWSLVESDWTSAASLPDGTYTAQAEQADAAGNTGRSESRTFRVDTTAPETTISSGPSGTVQTASAEFAFTASETASFECRLDDGAWASCSSPKSYSGVAPGPHTFEVRATDPLGHTDPTAATRAWTVVVYPDDDACTVIWTGRAGNSSWHTAGNWATGQVPTATDRACVPAGQVARVTQTTAVGSVHASGTVEVAATFEVTDTARATRIAKLELEAGGVLSGAGQISVTESLDWLAGGLMRSGGPTVIEAGASGRIAAGSGTAYLDGRDLINYGDLTWDSGAIQAANAPIVRNVGIFHANSEGGPLSTTNSANFENEGSLYKDAGTGTTEIAISFSGESAYQKTGTLRITRPWGGFSAVEEWDPALADSDYGPSPAADYCIADPEALAENYCGENDDSNPAVIEAAAAASGPGGIDYGLSDQSASTLSDPSFLALGLQRIRRNVPYDIVTAKDAAVATADPSDDVDIDNFREVEEYLNAARGRFEVLITFDRRRGDDCEEAAAVPGFDVDVPTTTCYLPSVAEYRDAVLAFRKAFPWIRQYSAWNEPNHKRQPTSKFSTDLDASLGRYDGAYRAGRFWRNLNWQCNNPAAIVAPPGLEKCVAVAGELLDGSVGPIDRTWFQAYLEGMAHRARVWSYHPYTAGRTGILTKIEDYLRSIPGSPQIWFTEQGAVHNEPSKRYRDPITPARQQEMLSHLNNLLSIAPVLRARGVPHATKIKKFYLYQWRGDPIYDAGLVHLDGTRRSLLYCRYASAVGASPSATGCP